MKTFKDILMQGKATQLTLHSYIDEWHKSESKLPLHEYLGLTKEEYFFWIKPDLTLSYLLWQNPYLQAYMPKLRKLTEDVFVMHYCLEYETKVLEEIKEIINGSEYFTKSITNIS